MEDLNLTNIVELLSNARQNSLRNPKSREELDDCILDFRSSGDHTALLKVKEDNGKTSLYLVHGNYPILVDETKNDFSDLKIAFDPATNLAHVKYRSNDTNSDVNRQYTFNTSLDQSLKKNYFKK